MSGLSIGELSRNTLMSQQNRQIKNKIEALSEQMVTGQVKDITKHLNGNFHELADIEHRLKALKHYKQSMQQAASILNVTHVNAGPKLHRTPERKCTIWLDLAGVKLRQLVGFRFVHGPARRSAPTKQRSCAGLWSNRGAVFALQALRDCRLCLRR